MIDVGVVPPLHNPLLIAAFEGWNDAGEAASSTVRHLRRAWRANQLGAMDPEEFYDFQVNRPRATSDGIRRRIVWPTTRVFLARDTPFGRDVVLVQGIEPSTRWRTFTVELVELASRLDVSLVITLGALLADVPHSRPLPVTATSDDQATRQRYEVDENSYQGPTGIVGVFSDAATRAGFESLSCWVAIPHYAGGAPSPKGTLSLLTTLEHLLGMTVDRAELTSAAREWEHTVDELASADEEVADYVASLEVESDSPEQPDASGDAIAREFDRYLRNLGETGEGGEPGDQPPERPAR